GVAPSVICLTLAIRDGDRPFDGCHLDDSGMTFRRAAVLAAPTGHCVHRHSAVGWIGGARRHTIAGQPIADTGAPLMTFLAFGLLVAAMGQDPSAKPATGLPLTPTRTVRFTT